ncbi:hypothetical protein BC829DRAFT_492145 [Chytridium lagenaria]|nr:hypothetical protein BC829DRAFT_492145 [Chytridium lagenaria]
MVTPMNAGDDTLQIATTQKYTPDYATVRFYRNNNPVDSLEFTLAPGESRSFRTDFSAPSNAIQGLYPIYSGYITVSVKGEDTKAATVPYAGLVGDWKAAPSSPAPPHPWMPVSALSPPNSVATASPSLRQRHLCTGVYSPTNAFQPSQQVQPSTSPPALSSSPGKAWSTLSPLGIKRQTSMFLFASDSFSLQPDAANAITSAGPASLFFGQGIQRNSVLHATSLPRPTLYRWKGDVITNATEVNAQRVKIPAGQYQIRFTALRHFGRINAPVAGTDFDTVMSPVLNLVY